MGRDDLKPMVVFFTNTFSTFSGLRTLNYLGNALCWGVSESES